MTLRVVLGYKPEPGQDHALNDLLVDRPHSQSRTLRMGVYLVC